jgi:5-methylcytosine-specific restriction endonuclease McrA
VKTIQKTFSVNEENERSLIKKTYFNEQGQKEKEENYYDNSTEETIYIYNSQEFLSGESLIVDGIDVSSQHFDYDEKGNVVLEEHYVNGELYEKIDVVFNGNQKTRITHQDGVEIERFERVENGKNWTAKYFVDNELVEQREYSYDAEKREGVLLIESFEYNVIAKTIDTFDADDQLVKQEEFSNTGDRVYSLEIIRENGNVVLERINNLKMHGSCSEKHFIYDRHGNELSYELKNCNGILIEFHHKTYDDLNRVIEEKGTNNISESTDYSNIRGLKYFHLVHTYENMNA